MSKGSRDELVKRVHPRYLKADKAEKGRILDEFVITTGYHRKHAIRLLKHGLAPGQHERRGRKRTYAGETVRQLVTVWEVTGRICGKRLQPFLPTLVAAMERHNELCLDEVTRAQLLQMSAATIDRKKALFRQGRGRTTTKPGKLLRESIPIRTFTEWDVTVESTADLPEGLSVTGFGMSKIREFTDQPIGQDDPNNACSAQWVEEVVATDSALMEITMSAAAPALDVDLYLVLDGGDGVFDCWDDVLVASSAMSGSAESVSVTFPPDGRYFVVAHGWSVPGGSGLFDITIRNIQGNNVIVHDLPSGPIAAGEAITFGVEARVDHEPGAVMSGLLFVGPTDAPLAMNLPITVTVPEPGDGRLLAKLSVAPDAVKTGEQAAFSLWVSNQGAEEEAASMTINVPSGLVLVPGSAAASVGQAQIDLLNRTVTWQGILEVGQSATITFDATGSTFSGRADVGAKVTGAVRNTTTNLSVPVWINTPRPPTMIFTPMVGGH